MTRAKVPGLLLGMVDGGASLLERRVLALLEKRAGWCGRGRVVGACVCAVVMGALSAGVAMVAVGPVVFAQEAKLLQATGPLPKYEVATVKPAKDASGSQAGANGPSEFFVKNFTVKDLLQMAYDIRSDNQLDGVTGWMTTERFDVQMKLGPEEIAKEEKLEMMPKIERWKLLTQALLKDRFGLKVSEATREVSVYDLVATKGGAKLKPSEMVDDPKNPGKKMAVKPPTEQLVSPGKIVASAVPMEVMTEGLGRLLELGAGKNFGGGRMVVDKTGLTGVYDWTLRWSPMAADGSVSAVNADAPGLFTALEEQLGMKLVPGKAPVQVLVVEHIERPTEN